jgi:hypothetical protein
MQGWKTLIFGALITFLGGIQATDLASVIPAEYTGIVLTGIGMVVMFLRTITKTPVMKSE